MSDDIPEFFVDMITNVSMANGVFRITFAQQEANNTSRAAVKVLLPASQLAAVLKGLGNAASEIENRLKAPEAAKAGPPPPPAPGAVKKSPAAAKKGGKK